MSTRLLGAQPVEVNAQFAVSQRVAVEKDGLGSLRGIAPTGRTRATQRGMATEGTRGIRSTAIDCVYIEWLA